MNRPTTHENNRILVIDDNPAIHEDFRKVLGPPNGHNAALEDVEAHLFGQTPQPGEATGFEIDSAFQGKEGLGMVERAVQERRPYAMAFVDVRMPPGWDGVETIHHLWQAYPELQVVICTAYSDYSWDDIARQLGKSDNLVILKKPFDNIEVLQLAHALTTKWLLNQQAKVQLDDLDKMVSLRTQQLRAANQKLQQEIAERQQAEAALRLLEERFSKAFKASPLPLAIQTLGEGRYLDVNESFLQMTGLSRDQVLGRVPLDLNVSFDPQAWQQMLERLRSQLSIRNQESKVRTQDGQLHDTLICAEVFNLGVEPHMLVIIQDISERQQLEAQLRQAQKMEAVGQLASGIAHDFNNILTVIQGHAALVMLKENLDHELAESMQQITNASERAASLTRQLLAFSRKQMKQPKVLDLNEVVGNLDKMLRRLIGEHIQSEGSNSMPWVKPVAGEFVFQRRLAAQISHGRGSARRDAQGYLSLSNAA